MGKKTKKSKTVLRLLKYVFTTYKLQFFIVCIAIIASSIVSVIGIQFIQKLIDNYIIPLIGQQKPRLYFITTSNNWNGRYLFSRNNCNIHI